MYGLLARAGVGLMQSISRARLMTNFFGASQAALAAVCFAGCCMADGFRVSWCYPFFRSCRVRTGIRHLDGCVSYRVGYALTYSSLLQVCADRHLHVPHAVLQLSL